MAAPSSFVCSGCMNRHAVSREGDRAGLNGDCIFSIFRTVFLKNASRLPRGSPSVQRSKQRLGNDEDEEHVGLQIKKR